MITVTDETTRKAGCYSKKQVSHGVARLMSRRADGAVDVPRPDVRCATPMERSTFTVDRRGLAGSEPSYARPTTWAAP